jgi:hemoglobin-like flavoprotein
MVLKWCEPLRRRGRWKIPTFATPRRHLLSKAASQLRRADSAGKSKMNSDQVALIQYSFAKITPTAKEAAALFYGRLFEIAPEVEQLFHGDVKEQGRKLMATLAVVVDGLTDLATILPAASALAKRHVAYGVRAEHYAPVGVALLSMLERRLGAEWTSDLAAAWANAYTTLSEYMIDEAYGRREAAE